DNATEIAHLLGVSEAVIGLTIVAAGTSLPELATSIVAARKGQSAIAIGNVIGSNVFNILFIIGLTGVITPMQIVGLTNIDFAVMLGSMLLLWLMSFTKYTLSRWEGAVLAVLYVVYVGWLIYNV
ncbi:MAG: sodium:calcium antiporter, partial [Prevotella sp.]|nr:sodium:calcium antiporter [Prevotella sp.]